MVLLVGVYTRRIFPKVSKLQNLGKTAKSEHRYRCLKTRNEVLLQS